MWCRLSLVLSQVPKFILWLKANSGSLRVLLEKHITANASVALVTYFGKITQNSFSDHYHSNTRWKLFHRYRNRNCTNRKAQKSMTNEIRKAFFLHKHKSTHLHFVSMCVCCKWVCFWPFTLFAKSKLMLNNYIKWQEWFFFVPVFRTYMIQVRKLSLESEVFA